MLCRCSARLEVEEPIVSFEEWPGSKVVGEHGKDVRIEAKLSKDKVKVSWLK